jgi:hypothetical protein
MCQVPSKRTMLVQRSVAHCPVFLELSTLTWMIVMSLCSSLATWRRCEWETSTELR